MKSARFLESAPWLGRALRLTATLVVALQALVLGACSKPEPVVSPVTIYRDAWGVPHVHGKTDADAAFGFAFAQAEDNFGQIEDNFIRAVGRAAEVHGEGALLDDWITHSLESVRLSIEEYQGADEGLKALLDGFASGLNHFVQSRRVTPKLLERFEPWHPLAFIRYLYYQRGFLFSAGIPPEAFDEAFRRSLATEPTRASSFAPPESERGSNSWAVAPRRSASGNALLLINPHLPFFGPSQVYEGHVLSDDGWNFSGYTRFGFPLPYVGFGEHLGWASTDNAADLADAYLETFDDSKNPLAYRYGDAYRTASEWTATLAVRIDGQIEQRLATFRKTHHGPLVAVLDDKAVALRMAKFEEPGWLQQWYRMSRASSLAEFERASSRLDMLFGNYLYADVEGNIYYVYNAAVPIRSTSYDWTLPVDGSDPETEWRGYHSIEEIPRLLNPETGWIQNCNGSPFLSTSEGNPREEDYPFYMVGEGDNPRHRQARRILSSKKAFTFDEWAGAAYSTEVLLAIEEIPEIVAEWETEGDESLAEAVGLLRDWNRVSAVDSTAMTLFVFWAEEYDRLLRERGELPERLEALAEALSRLERDWESWRIPWGDVNRLQRRDSHGQTPFVDGAESLPIAGVPSWAGGMFTFAARPQEGSKRRYGVAGNTYVAVLELGAKVESRTLHTFGASADPGSPHFFDQAERYARGDFKPAWLYLDDVKNNAASSYAP